MIIEINKDIENYKESVVFGLTAKQILAAIICVGLGAGTVLLLYPYIGLTGAAYIAVPVSAPAALNGFYSYNGMSFFKLWKKRFHFMFANKPLKYVSTQGVRK